MQMSHETVSKLENSFISNSFTDPDLDPRINHRYGSEHENIPDLTGSGSTALDCTVPEIF
jgi:hypothetical protein